MGQANLLGGAGGGGIRQKSITQEGYDALTKEQRENPYIIWIITNPKTSAIGNVTVDNLIVKATIWNNYQSLSVDDRLDPHVQWIITDKNLEDLAAMGYGAQNTGQGSSLYEIAAEMDHAKLVERYIQLEQRVGQMESALTRITAILNG